MTLSELNKWRLRVPWFVFALCVIPWIWIATQSVEKTKLYAETVVPILACIATFLYVGSDFRQSRWKKELRDHVGAQIRQTLVDMVPDDLAVTNDERNELMDREILRELTGIFWEGIDNSPKLQNLKANQISFNTLKLICGKYNKTLKSLSIKYLKDLDEFNDDIYKQISLLENLVSLKVYYNQNRPGIKPQNLKDIAINCTKLMNFGINLHHFNTNKSANFY